MKSHNTQCFKLSLEDAVFEKPQGCQIDPLLTHPAALGLRTLFLIEHLRWLLLQFGNIGS